MSQHVQLIFAATFAVCCVGCVFAFLAWLIWSLGWEIFDHFMQRRRRARNNRFDGARTTQRQAFRDVRGVHR